ncbi:MAG: aerobic carbon-monoxide dehydrogenase large subunit, partial [Gaiellaceae bacterium]|nr:aerobic carbon-monoxide dehydrogenase large subunit [Gaiellaceae bacterium]
ECTGVFTNTVPTDAYRGAGRPEATYAIERAVDALARAVGKDPVEIRRVNFIRGFPATIASGLTIDSGDFDASLDKVLELVDYASVRKQQANRRTAGDTKRLGIGLCTYVEMCGLAPSRILGAIRYGAGGWDAATIRCLPTGTVQALTGTSPHGQGHETSWSQIVADRLGYEIDEVEVLHGDTSVVPLGMDTYGSRSLAVGGVALYYAAERIVEKAKTIAAHLMQVDESQIEHVRGTFQGPEESMTLKEVAFSAWTAHDLPAGVEPGLDETYVYDPPNFSWPSGAHVAIVEVDTETGAVELLRYVAVDDVGTVVNPIIVDGQIQGGLAQGVAQALYEEAIYDEDGNLLTGNMVSYLVPTAAEFPRWELHRTETPSPTNPMGVKGVGETGAIASPAAVMNAVVDALAADGVTDIDMPATPERVWRALEEVRR